MQRRLFSLLSRTGVALYSRAPIFGYLRASVAIIRNGDSFLVIQRSDGRGYSFPGGLRFFWESPEKAMRREVLEETGMRVQGCRLLFEHRTRFEVRCVLTVFEASVSGDLKDSWEGSPCWRRAPEIRDSLLPSQRGILERLVG